MANFFQPAHVLVMLSFLMLIIAETGSIPVDSPSGHFELAMVDESKVLEYSGRGAALMKWGSSMKSFVLFCIFLNVLVSPWGLASGQTISDALLAVPLILLKIMGLVLALVVIESSLAKLRLFRIPEFLGAAFVTSVAAVITKLMEI
jgi:formate hydrogenlyase subunit 4